MRSIVFLLFTFVVFDLSMTEESECTGQNCEQISYMPLLDNMEERGDATPKADSDVSKQNKFLKRFISQVVKKEVENIMRENMKKIMNETVSNVENLFKDRTNEMKLDLDSKFKELTRKNEMEDEENTVVLTAQLRSEPAPYGIMKFDHIRFSVGYKNISAYKSTGKFICEKVGIYLISASIVGGQNSQAYYLFVNDDPISHIYIGYNSNNPSITVHTGTIVIAMQLHPNDSVWVRNSGGNTISTWNSSTLTIVKVK